MRLFKGTRYWKPQLTGLAATFCLFLGVIGPTLQNSSAFYGYGFGLWRTLRNLLSLSLLSSPEWLLKLGGWLLLAAAGASLFLLSELRMRDLKKLTIAMIPLVLFLVAYGISQIDLYYDLKPVSLLPLFLHPQDVFALGWSWYFLLLSPLLFWIACSHVRDPEPEERGHLLREHPPIFGIPRFQIPQLHIPRLQSRIPSASGASVSRPVQTNAARTPLTASTPPTAQPVAANATAQATALPSDVGLCSSCGARNSRRATKCHECAATLPWEQERLNKAASAAKVAAARKAQVASVAASTGGAAGSVFLTGFLHFLVFCLCMMIPAIGFFVWRVLDTDESKYAGASFWGWVTGAILIVGGFLLRFLLAMARVGSS